MAEIKCKMCGETINLDSEERIVSCGRCGSRQTVPIIKSDKESAAFERANKLRMKGEFDKAIAVYESIIADYPEEPEAYWGICLCKYGIIYIDMPEIGDMIPVCFRSSFDSLMYDPSFEMVMENCESDTRSIYRYEAKHIEDLRKEIIDTARKEKPKDIFFCCCEKNEHGEKTPEFAVAEELYKTLKKNYKVFFPAIDLKKKTIDEREAYIFAAINSAKLMLVFGSSYEDFNNFQIKNEWSRFVQLVQDNKEKFLIPCYKNIDPYDIPQEFLGLQSFDMNEDKAMDKLIFAIDDLPWNGTPEVEEEKTSHEKYSADPQALLKRGYMAITDGDFVKADDFFEHVLNVDAENGHAYWGKLLIEYEAKSIEELTERLVAKVERNKITKHIHVEIPQAFTIARSFSDKITLLNEFSNDELDEVFKNINLESEYEIATDYYEKIVKKWNDYSVQAIASSKNYDRAFIYGDDEIKSRMESLNKETLKLIKKLYAADNAVSTAEEKAKYARNLIGKQLELCEKKYLELQKEDIDEDIQQDATQMAKIRAMRHGVIKDMLTILNLRVGDSLTFGNYPYGANGETKPVDWKVIAIEKGRVLIVTEKAIDTMPYNTVNEMITWEECALRKFMNSHMFDGLFNKYEREMVSKTHNVNTDNQTYGTKGGRDTFDWLFILNIEEAYRYIPDKADRSVKPTPYVKSKGIYANKKTGNIWWWLRSPGYSNMGASIVHYDGRIDDYGDKATWEQSVIRPVCWLKVEE